MLNLWRKCSDYLVIVEEGSRKGNEIIDEIRTYLSELEDDNIKGHIFSPVFRCTYLFNIIFL